MISSPTNPRIKAAAALRRRSEREQTGLFLIEGRIEVARAVRSGIEIEELFLLEGSPAPSTTAALSPIVLSESAYDKIAYGRDGTVAVARRPAFELESLVVSDPALVLVIEAIEKPGNLGAMLRTADAAGAAVVVADPVTDLTNPNVVRASLGTLFTVPVAQTTVESALTWLATRGIALMAATVDEGSAPWDHDLQGPSAIAIGAESAGLSITLVEGASERVRIPMLGAADSLNASTSAAVLLFEAVRQRSRDR